MNREQFEKTRQEFEQLRTEDKAVFLVEAVVSTLARGVEQFGQAVADELNRAFKKREEDSAGAAGAAEETRNGNGAPPETPPM